MTDDEDNWWWTPHGLATMTGAGALLQVAPVVVVWQASHQVAWVNALAGVLLAGLAVRTWRGQPPAA